jgi:glycosyltransferase involved in cell wall biosynthesis
MKIGAGLIVRNEESNIVRMLEQLRLFADEICVVDTGSTDETRATALHWRSISGVELTYLSVKDCSELVDGEYLISDFAKARNHYVKYLDSRVDYVFTASCGNEIEDPKRIRDLLKLGADAYTFDIKRGGSTFKHYRMFRTKGGVEYKGIIHEVPMINSGTVHKVKDSGITIVHEAGTGPSQEDAIKRNVRLCKRMYLETPSARSCFYYANALKDSGEFKQAAERYKAYLLMESWRDERMFAYLYLVRCLFRIRELNEALHYGWAALKEDLRFSEISMEMARIYYKLENWNYALAMCFLSIKDTPNSPMFIEKDQYLTEPLRLIEEIERRKHGSKKHISKALF